MFLQFNNTHLFQTCNVYVKCLFDLNVVVYIPQNETSLFVFVIHRKWAEFENGPGLMYIENGPIW